MSRRGAPVVITRKDKRLHKAAHLTAFVLTGGASGVVTAAKAGTNAAYNARTRKLAAEADTASETAGEGTVNLLALSLRPGELLAVLKGMTSEELTEVVTMPSGRVYSYWRDGAVMTAAERVVRGAAKRELARRPQAAAPDEQAEFRAEHVPASAEYRERHGDGTP
jgi:hypothetical protein